MKIGDKEFSEVTMSILVEHGFPDCCEKHRDMSSASMDMCLEIAKQIANPQDAAELMAIMCICAIYVRDRINSSSLNKKVEKC